MDHMFLFVVLATSYAQILFVAAQPPQPTSHFTIQGSVFCDLCYENTFSKQSYFLPGVDVHVQCKFKANSPRTTEQIAFSVNRTTDRYGMYKLDIPSVDGLDCVEDPSIQSFCQASLIRSPSSLCNVLGLASTTDVITIKSKQNNLCIYSMSALSYRPPVKNVTLCSNQKMELPYTLNSKFFLPYFPPQGIRWPQSPQLPPLPPIHSLPPLPQLPSLPSAPITIPRPPFLPFPFPPIPPLPPPPAFKIGDPRTWISSNPVISPPPPPVFDLENPRTWIPYGPPSPIDRNDLHP